MLSLWLSLTLAASPLAPTALPPDFKLDASLEEWKGPPTWVLDAKDQLVQRRASRKDALRKVTSPDDLSARLWLAASEDGLILAGEVNDDHFVPRTDRVQLWLALPRARMPRIAYVNQLGENELPDPAACDTSELKDPEACKRWFQAQVVRRRRLEELFIRHYQIGDTVTESYATAGGVVDPALDFKCCGASQVKRVVTESGWRFEARIAPEDFPLAGEAPLAHLQVAVEVDDGDQENGTRAEAILSSVPTMTTLRTSSLQSVTLERPLAFDSEPPLLVALRKEQADRFYPPGRPVQKAFAFENPAVGGQDQPKEPSPTVMTFTLGKLPLLTTEGEARLFRVHSDEGDWLWSERHGEAVAHLPGTGALTGPVMRKGGQDVALLQEGTRSPFGTGECGACPNVEIRVVRIKGDGRLQQTFRELVQEGVDLESNGQHFRLEGITGSVTPDLSQISFNGTQIIAGEGSEKRAPFEAIWRYDAEEGRYVSPRSEGGLPAPRQKRKKKR